MKLILINAKSVYVKNKKIFCDCTQFFENLKNGG